MVDTEPLYKAAWQQAAADFGLRPGRRAVRDTRRTSGAGLRADSHGVLRGCLPAGGLSQAVARLVAAERRADRRRTRSRVCSSSCAFVKNARLPMAVATSSEAEYASFTLSRADLGGWFDAIVSGDQVDAREAVLPTSTWRRRAGSHVTAADCVAFEDSEAGIQAVSRAGMTGVLVPHWPVSADVGACRLSGRRHASRRRAGARFADRWRARRQARRADV